jgi:hypothetical protein
MLWGLSVFRGGFTRQAAQHVTGTSFLNLPQLQAVLKPTQPNRRISAHTREPAFAGDRLPLLPHSERANA